MRFKYFFEARLQDNQTTEGIDAFIETLQNSIENESLLNDIKSIIAFTKCPSISFEPLRGALGISKTDKCIINSQILNSDVVYILYVILHEIAHQRQYSKYGEDIATDIFLGNISSANAATKLLKIENTADRWAKKMVVQLCKKYGIYVQENSIPQAYKQLSLQHAIQQVNIFRQYIKSNNIKTIEQANDLIHNLIK